MKRLYLQCVFVIAFLSFASCPTRSCAQGHVPSDSEKVAIAAIGRLASLCQNAQTLAFTFRFQPNTSDGKVAIIRGFAEKPNKFHVEELVDGKSSAVVVSDGEIVYAYQVSTRHYQTMTALKTYANAQDKAVLAQTTDLLGEDFRPILMFFSGTPDLAGLADPRESKNSVSYTSSTAIVDGIAVTRVLKRVTLAFPTLLFSQFGVQYDFDTRTGLLHDIQLGSISPRLNRLSSFYRLTFSSFRLGTVPLPTTIFVWTPPVGSVLGVPKPGG